MQASALSRRAAWGLPIFGGFLHALAFPPFGFMLLALVSITPLLIAVRNASGKHAFWRGYLFGLVFGLPNMFWLHAFVSRWTGSWLLGAVPWLLVCGAFALYFGLFGWLAGRAWKLGWLWAIPLCWAAVEVFRSKIPILFYPWSLNGGALYKLPAFVQSAHILGEFFVGAWLCTIALVAAMAMCRDQFKPRVYWRYAAVCLAVLGGSIALYMVPPAGETKTYGSVQPGVDLAFTPIGQQQGLLSERIPEALSTVSSRRTDLLVLPEGIGRWRAGAEQPDIVFDAAGLGNVVVGGQRAANGASFQSAFGFDGNRWSAVDKTRLVIFGEYVPFRDQLPFLEAFDVPSGDLRPGKEIGTLELEGLKVAPVLCFEALFEEVSRVSASRGAEVIAISSIDDWYQGTGAIQALISGAVMRAIENGLPAVRSASLGPSAIIDARGNIIAYAEEGETRTIVAEAAARGSKTHIPRLAFQILAVLVAVLVIVRRLKPD